MNFYYKAKRTFVQNFVTTGFGVQKQPAQLLVLSHALIVTYKDYCAELVNIRKFEQLFRESLHIVYIILHV